MLFWIMAQTTVIFITWSQVQHCLLLILLGDSENAGPNENWGLFNCHEGYKLVRTLKLLFLLVFGLFSKVSTLFAWRVIKTTDAITHFQGCRCSIEHQRLIKWKLSLQWFHSWRIPHHSRRWPKMMTLLWKKAGNLFLFSKSLKWVTGGQ